MSTPSSLDPLEEGTGRLLVPTPANVVLGHGSRIVADAVTQRAVFARLRSRRSPAIVIGDNSLIDGAAFNLDEAAVVTIGSRCQVVECFLIGQQEIIIGDDVVIGWHATIVDSDFHPVTPADRRDDVLALSPLAQGNPRRLGVSKPVVIGNRVWIGPLAVVLKGVHIGDNARIEPGAVVSRDVPAGARMLGNPAKAVAESE